MAFRPTTALKVNTGESVPPQTVIDLRNTAGVSRIVENGAKLDDYLDEGKFKEAVLYTSNEILIELCKLTGINSCIAYGPMYSVAVKELDKLQEGLRHLVENKVCTSEELFELAQGVGFLLPRAYLVITTGSLLMNERHEDLPFHTQDVSPNHPFSCCKGVVSWPHAVFADLVSACEGELHPIPGLFLRRFLLYATSSYLPGERGYKRLYHNSTEVSNAASSKNASNLALASALQLVDYISGMGKLFEAMLTSQRSSEKSHLVSNSPQPATPSQKEDLGYFIGAPFRRLGALQSLKREDCCEKILPLLLKIAGEARKAPILQEYIMLSILNLFPSDYYVYALHSVAAFIVNSSEYLQQRLLFHHLVERLTQAGEKFKFLAAKDPPASGQMATESGTTACTATAKSPKHSHPNETMDSYMWNRVFDTLLDEVTNGASQARYCDTEVNNGDEKRDKYVVSLVAFGESLLRFSFMLENADKEEGWQRVSRVLSLIRNNIQPKLYIAVSRPTLELLSYIASYSPSIEFFLMLDGVQELLLALSVNDELFLLEKLCSTATRKKCMKDEKMPSFCGSFHTVEGVKAFWSCFQQSIRSLLEEPSAAVKDKPRLRPQPVAPKAPSHTKNSGEIFSTLIDCFIDSDPLISVDFMEIVVKALEKVRNVTVLTSLSQKLIFLLHTLCDIPSLQEEAGEEKSEIRDDSAKLLKADVKALKVERLLNLLHQVQSSDSLSKGIFEQLALLDLELGLCQYIDAISVLDKLNLADILAAFTMEILQLLENCAREEIRLKFIDKVVSNFLAVQCLSKEVYIDIASGISRQGSLLIRKENQCLTLAKCAVLFTRSFLSTEQQEKGAKNVERSLKMSSVLSPLSFRLEVQLDILEISIQHVEKIDSPSLEWLTCVLQCIATIRKAFDDNEQGRKSMSEIPFHQDPQAEEIKGMKNKTLLEKRFKECLLGLTERAKNTPKFATICEKM